MERCSSETLLLMHVAAAPQRLLGAEQLVLRIWREYRPTPRQRGERRNPPRLPWDPDRSDVSPPPLVTARLSRCSANTSCTDTAGYRGEGR